MHLFIGLIGLAISLAAFMGTILWIDSISTALIILIFGLLGTLISILGAFYLIQQPKFLAQLSLFVQDYEQQLSLIAAELDLTQTMLTVKESETTISKLNNLAYKVKEIERDLSSLNPRWIKRRQFAPWVLRRRWNLISTYEDSSELIHWLRDTIETKIAELTEHLANRLSIFQAGLDILRLPPRTIELGYLSYKTGIPLEEVRRLLAHAVEMGEVGGDARIFNDPTVGVPLVSLDQISLTYILEDKLVTCSICRQLIFPNDRTQTCPSCFSEFHFNHLAEWLRENSTCPICREQM